MKHIHRPGKISIRTLDSSNENHHLCNNNGVWSLHYTLHPTPMTKQRVRVSLGTTSVEEARALRDRLFAEAGVKLKAIQGSSLN
ncbi:MAG: hypothetical protein RL095_1488 [Verrucomicrobiota bacterium]|jgi:hypothetical protein